MHDVQNDVINPKNQSEQFNGSTRALHLEQSSAKQLVTCIDQSKCEHCGLLLFGLKVLFISSH